MSKTIHRTRMTIGVLLAVLAAAACGGSPAASAPASSAPSASAPSVAPSTAPSTEPSDDGTASPSGSIATSGRIVVADHGFAMTLPDGWTRIDLEAGDLEAMFEAAGAQNPELAGLYSQQVRAMLAQGLVLFALGPDPTSGTNLNVLSTPSMGFTLDFLEQANMAQLEALADGDIQSERVTLPAGDAVHLRYKVAAGSGVPSPTIHQYLLINGAKALMVSVTNASDADAAALAQSIELLS
jgi:hypothetical protein